MIIACVCPCFSQLHRSFDFCTSLGCHLAFSNTVLGEVEFLVLNQVQLANISVLGGAQEGLNALRVVAKSEKEVFLQLGVRCLILGHLLRKLNFIILLRLPILDYKPKLRFLHSFNFFQKLLSSNFKRAIPNYRFQRKIGKADELKIMKNNEAT